MSEQCDGAVKNAKTRLQDMWRYRSTALSAGKASGAVLCQDCGTVLQKKAWVTWRKFKREQGDLDNRQKTETTDDWMQVQIFKYIKDPCKETEIVCSSPL